MSALSTCERLFTTPAEQSAIVQLAEKRLHNHRYLALRNVSCHLKDGHLILQGELPTYYLKQVAQVVVSRLQGVSHIVNNIEVSRGRRI